MFNISHKEGSCFIKKYKKLNLANEIEMSHKNFCHKHLLFCDRTASAYLSGRKNPLVSTTPIIIS